MSLKNRLWQQTMIALARSDAIRRFMQSNALTTGLAQQFVAGKDSAALLDRQRQLKAQAINVSGYYLGEYVTTTALVEENVSHILAMIAELGSADEAIHVSVDPTQIGYAISDELGWQNALRIGQALMQQSRPRGLMIDMEDHEVTDKSIELCLRLRDQGIAVGITLQAYLFRTEADLKRITEQGAMIRLVKGAFAEDPSIAWTRKADIDASYLRLVELLLDPARRERGVYPVFATHDDRMIEAIKPLAQANGWQPDQYEFEMLLGVRPELQRALVDEGYSLRLYVPFGTEWWAYTVRRIGENPANLRFVLQAIRRG